MYKRQDQHRLAVDEFIRRNGRCAETAQFAAHEIHHLRHMGGILPTDQEIYDTVRALQEVES